MSAVRVLLVAVAAVATMLFIAAAPTAGNWWLPFMVAVVSLGLYSAVTHIDRRRGREAGERLGRGRAR